MSCQNNLFDYISNCGTTLNVYALLEPAKPYTWMITDKHQKEYTGEIISTADGFLEIPITDLPDGFFTPYSGSFTFEILNDCGKIDFKVAQLVDKIIFDVKGGNRQKNNLGCNFDCITSGQGTNAIFPFTDEAIVTLEWTSLLKSIYGNTPTVQVYHQTGPDTYDLANVSIQLQGTPYDLNQIVIDNGGTASGYIIVSL